VAVAPAAAGDGVELDEAVAVHADPERAAAVEVGGADEPHGQGGGVAVGLAEHPEPVAVVAVEAVGGAQPEVSLPVLHDAGDHVVGEALAGGQVFDADGLGGEQVGQKKKS
jgi:hypothetical protein